MSPVKINDRLLTRYVAKEANAQEKNRVEAWAKQSEKNQQRLNEWRRLMDLYADLPAADPVTQEELDAWWIQLRRRMKQPRVKPGLVLPGWFQIAALVILFAGLATIAYVSMQPQLPASNKLQLVGDGKRKDTLPDGSQVILSPGSMLLFNTSLNGRDARLEGSGLFEVQHDSTKPFRVLVRDITVTDIGTSFLIQSDTGDTRIKLLSGKVNVTTKIDSVYLEPGDSVRISLTGTILRELSPVVICGQSQHVSGILQDIKEQHLVKDSIQWFVLSNEFFLINSSLQPENVFQQFKTKYPVAKDSCLCYGPIRFDNKGDGILHRDTAGKINGRTVPEGKRFAIKIH